MATQQSIIKIKRAITLVGLVSVFILLFLLVQGKTPTLPRLMSSTPLTGDRLWKYQCIDTMKTSRDKARMWAKHAKLDALISREMKAIKDMGANCVALDTPYDDEFLPYLKKWVGAARKEDLHIWYRGNFSSWEGWFNYPKGMTEQELFSRTTAFIKDNASLFEDHDIFTPAPEGENGGPFEQVEVDEHEKFRAFLIKEHVVAKAAFQDIGRDVEVNWMSMNGGLAKRMFDQPTIDALDKTVALDHYIKTAPEMGEFIRYFAEKYGAKVVLGEFGAPIPDINGEMSEREQAEFIESLFRELYREKNHVEGVNYWVLFDSSTELYNKNFTPRLAANIVKKYFKPNVIQGRITDDIDVPVAGILVRTKDNMNSTSTDKDGNFTLLIPGNEVTLQVVNKEYHPFSQQYRLQTGKTNIKISITPVYEDPVYKLRKIFNKKDEK